MKITAPDYYNSFKCIADKCKHNCCIGWEIDIDSDTLNFYKSVKGRFQKLFKKHINIQEGQASFTLTKKERCPFLNRKGLCDIINEFGEDALCQICSDHPRFRGYFSQRTEIGIGLCCEEAARMIIANKNKVKLICLNEDTEVPTQEEKEFFLLREQAFNILQDRTLSIENRVQSFLKLFDTSLPPKTYKEWACFLKSLERLDKKWDKYLKLLENYSGQCETKIEDIYFEQLLVYFAYRHLSFTQELKERAAFVVFSYHIIKALCHATYIKKGRLSQSDIIEISRMYSSEIEYSEENTDNILDFLY